MKKDNPIEVIKRFSTDKETKQKLMELLIKQLSHQVQHLQTCILNEDWDEIKKVCHKMKSTFTFLKMSRPSELTEILRNEAGIDILITTQQLHELENICLQIISDVKNELKNNF